MSKVNILLYGNFETCQEVVINWRSWQFLQLDLDFFIVYFILIRDIGAFFLYLMHMTEMLIRGVFDDNSGIIFSISP